MPADSDVHVFSDFDGTISEPDCLDLLLDRFGDPVWREIEESVGRKETVEAEALQRQFDLVRCTREEALRALDESVTIDPHFLPFVAWCRRHGVALTILSGGFRFFIEHLLKRAGVDGVTLVANEAKVEGKRWVVVSAQVERQCPDCNHCKKTSLDLARDRGKRIVYVGDGLTDRCVAPQADLLFAKKQLARICRAEGIAFKPYRHFGNVQAELKRWLKEREGQVR